MNNIEKIEHLMLSRLKNEISIIFNSGTADYKNVAQYIRQNKNVYWIYLSHQDQAIQQNKIWQIRFNHEAVCWCAVDLTSLIQHFFKADEELGVTLDSIELTLMPFMEGELGSIYITIETLTEGRMYVLLNLDTADWVGTKPKEEMKLNDSIFSIRYYPDNPATFYGVESDNFPACLTALGILDKIEKRDLFMKLGKNLDDQKIYRINTKL